MMQHTPALYSVHHVKIPVPDSAMSRDFHCRILGSVEEISFEEDGVLMSVALKDARSSLRFAVRRELGHAAGLGALDPVALAVATRAELDARAAHLDEHGTGHGQVMNAHIG